MKLGLGVLMRMNERVCDRFSHCGVKISVKFWEKFLPFSRFVFGSHNQLRVIHAPYYPKHTEAEQVDKNILDNSRGVTKHVDRC